MTDVYIRRKLGQESVTYLDPSLEKALKPTYGIIVYQEQVMRIPNLLAGYTLGEADVVRKAVAKKIPSLIRSELRRFIERAVERGPRPAHVGGARTADRDVRSLRVPEGPQRRVFDPFLPDRMAQGPLPGGVYGSAALVGLGQDGRRCALHRRVQGAAAATCLGWSTPSRFFRPT